LLEYNPELSADQAKKSPFFSIARQYTSALAEVGIAEPLIDKSSTTLEKSSVVTTVNLGKRLADP
jgi:hypothetical protein